MRPQILSCHEVSEVSQFSNFLLTVGEGTEPENENQMVHIDTKYIIPDDSIADLVTSVYGNLHENYADHEFVSQRIILCPKNKTADLINNHIINLLPVEGTTLSSGFCRTYC